jgi:hypothetical protein
MLSSMSDQAGVLPNVPGEENSLLTVLPPSLQAHLMTPVPDQLWHYTSMHGMHAILDRGEMYATDARFLNDRDELIHAAKFADELIQQQPHPQEVIDFVRQHVAGWFGIFLSLKNPFRNYVTCFTSRRDDLSQWRAYSAGSAGSSMAFDLRESYMPGGGLAPCVYRDEEKRRLLEDAFAEIFRVGDMHFKADPALLLQPDATLPAEIKARFTGAEENVKIAATRLLFPIMKILPLLKDSSFEAEDEWRIVSLGSDLYPQNDSILYRPRLDSLVPTKMVSIKSRDGRVPLTGLILGPGSHPDASDAVTRYLRSKEFAVQAEPSAVPYRSTTS